MSSSIALVQHHAPALLLTAAPVKEKGRKGKGRLRVTAPDRKRPKGLKGCNWRSSICIRRYLAQLCHVTVDVALEQSPVILWLVQVFSAKRKADPDLLRTCFSIVYIAADSAHLMPPRINIRRNVPFAAHIQIIRPPLHHLHTGFQMLRLMHIGRPHAVAFFVAHLPFNGIL